MKRKLDSLVGKSIWSCKFIGTRIDLNVNSFSLCHEVQAGGNRSLGKIEDLTIDTYYDALYQLIKDNESENAHCRKCKRLCEQPFELKKISFITINTSVYCNSSCIYCLAHFGCEGTGYNPIPYFEMFEKENLFTKDCFFDWGGGEPTLNPYFEESVKWIYTHGYRQRINTNAIIYSEATRQALMGGRASLRISIDSGTRECFVMVKGHENYELVWKNIKQYALCTTNIYLKYNICNYNSANEEIEAFLFKCKEAGVKHILIDAEVSSYQPEQNAGPFYFTEKELIAACFLENRAREQGFDVKISSYAFSVRAEYDKTGNLCLPRKYFDNIDKEVLSAGIGIKTFPSIKYMLKHLESNKNLPKAIWGFGVVGQKCNNILGRKGIKVDYIIDSSEEKQRSGYLGYKILSPEDFFSLNIAVQLILCGKFWIEMLKIINEKHYDKGEILYMYNAHYNNYMEEE